MTNDEREAFVAITASQLAIFKFATRLFLASNISDVAKIQELTELSTAAIEKLEKLVDATSKAVSQEHTHG
ncbi:hypothetical protein AWB64_02114 [Caballeronia sordidicola]|uniref:Uncharacterized protein n=1 Tax=Caballeronia sordidicola TaxID=196367 RepID=A0A158G1F8_CABSO|nr:hypothetical protein [Caballeronia sordidicola]SAL25934.1 hypothetical protein AWB64_02114 [Caballeronia sordidicola]